MADHPKISVVVPLYNEEEVIKESYRRLKEVMDSSGESYELVFVNDGSRDKTVFLAKEICEKDKNVKLISFARNFGHQLAITAGMDNASGDAIVVIDADLQDPPEVILEMIKKWHEGYEVVYGKRAKRHGETFFKKFTAKTFYRFLDSMTDVKIPVDTGDFRLIDRKVCDALLSVREHNRYIRGIVSWLGFKSTPVEFVREKRFAGETKYPLKKMIRFASDAIFSFSYKPLKLATYLGAGISILSIIYFIVTIILRALMIFKHSWFSIITMGCLFLLGGLILLSIGILGEYIARMNDEAKGRPLYIIGEKVNF